MTEPGISSVDDMHHTASMHRHGIRSLEHSQVGSFLLEASRIRAYIFASVLYTAFSRRGRIPPDEDTV
jgi:hypothetical protein